MATKTRAHRLTFRFRRWKLDHELAVGFDPNRNPDRARRASELTDPEFRNDVAQRLERLIDEASTSQSWQAPVRWAAVRDNARQITSLATALRAPIEVSAQGVARARLLLADGNSPLYGPADGDGLLSTVNSALASLELGPMLEPYRR